MKRLVVFDFAGTLVRPEVINEANLLRAKILQRSLPSRREHAQSEKLYKINREFVEKLTGLSKRFKIKYRKNDLKEMELTGEQVQNQIATNLFQIGMYLVAKKYQTDIFFPNLLSELKKLKKKGYRLAIVSGVRTDIISGMLNIAGVAGLFDYVKGQPPILGMTNQTLLKELEKEGKIVALVGDKSDDLLPAKKLKAKAIFADWGYPRGGERSLADVVISKPEELSKLLT